MLFKDAAGKLTIQQVISNGKFTPLKDNIVFNGSKSAWWIKFSVKNDPDEDKEFTLFFDNSWNKIDVYTVLSNNFSHQVSGDLTPINERTHKLPVSLASLSIPSATERTFYARFEYTGQGDRPARFIDHAESKKEYDDQSTKENLIQGIFLGIVAIMCIYNFFIFLSVRDKSYLFYVMMLLSVILIFLENSNFDFQFLWPGSPKFEIFMRTYPVVNTIAGFCILLFYQSFLNTRQNLPVLHWVMNIVNAFSISTSFLIFLHVLSNGNDVSNMLGVIIFALGLISGMASWLKGYKPARFFLLATFFSATCTSVYLIDSQFPFFSLSFKPYLIQIGYSLDVLFFSFALADRINLLMKENALAKQKIIKNEYEQEIMKEQAIRETEENERRRIAKDLHDSVSQMISSAKMNLQAFAGEFAFTSEKQKSKFEKIVGLVDDSFKEVRIISHNMMPYALHETGLEQVVKQLIDNIDSDKIKANLYSKGFENHFDDNMETTLYRIIQECVNNVIKHSGASKLDISLIRDCECISLTVEDNGKGFDSAGLLSSEGVGIKNIQNRVRFLHGDVEIDSKPGNGTVVIIRIQE